MTATGAANGPVADRRFANGSLRTGQAGDVGVSTGKDNMIVGVQATGAAGDVTVDADSNAPVTGATASAVANAVTPQISVTAPKAFATAQAGTVKSHASPREDFPVISIMRNTAVPAIGAVSNAAVAVVGRIKPSGPQPGSVAVIIVGVSALGAVRHVTPFRMCWYRSALLPPLAPRTALQRWCRDMTLAIESGGPNEHQ